VCVPPYVDGNVVGAIVSPPDQMFWITIYITMNAGKYPAMSFECFGPPATHRSVMYLQRFWAQVLATAEASEVAINRVRHDFIKRMQTIVSRLAMN
jgi:hypothetical protein